MPAFAKMLPFVPALLLGGLIDLAAAAETTRPNIVVILADDLGWVDHSVPQCSGGEASRFYETPNLQRMAREGMAFTRAYAAPNCAPTRAMLVSGQYMTRTRVYNVGNLNRGTGKFLGPDQREDVAADIVTLAETLRQTGYRTAHFGKYHVGGHEGGTSTLPQSQGFEVNIGGGPAGHAASYFPADRGRFVKTAGPGLEKYAAPYDQAYLDSYRTYSTDGTDRESDLLPESLIDKPKHLGDALTDATIDYLRSHAADPTPFYLQYHAFLVHTPIQARDDLESHFAAKRQAGNVDPRGHSHAKYAAMVRQLDQQVGRILRAITDPNGDGDESDSISEKTLVIFTSDNGGHVGPTNNSPLRGRKGMLTEGGIRVPMIAWQPETVPAGTTSDTLINAVDYYPTIAEIAGASLPDPQTQPIDGTSFASMLRGDNLTPRTKTLFWHFPGYLDTRATPISVISRDVVFDGREAQFKLMYDYQRQEYSLYNLSLDLGETTNLLVDPGSRKRHGWVADKLSRELRRWLDETGAIYPLEKQDSGTHASVRPPQPLSASLTENLSTTGNLWNIVPLATPHDVSFRAVHVVDQQVIWMSGQRGTVLRSTDGGTTWTSHTIPDSPNTDYRDVHGFDAKRAVAFSAGSPGRVMMTTDGGTTWTEQYVDAAADTFFDAAAFFDDQRGLLFGDPRDQRLLLVQTTDGGGTWRPADISSRPETIEGEAGFAASGTCLAVQGDRHVWIGLGGAGPLERGDPRARILFSRDAGSSWQSATSPLVAGPSRGVFSVSFRNAEHGVAVGGDYLRLNDTTSCAAVTSDGGTTWREPKGRGPSGFRSVVACTRLGERNLWVACGPEGCDVSLDDGESWAPLCNAGYHTLSFAPHSDFGVSVGADGVAARWTAVDGR